MPLNMDMKKIIVALLLLISVNHTSAQSAKAEWVILKSNNLKCWECKDVLDKYLTKEKENTEGGIVQWKINLLQGEVRIQFLPDRTSADEVRAAVNNAGFDTDKEKALDEAYKKLPPSCKRAEEGGGPQLRKPCHVKPYL
jgi:periplasmic mercuric ion binding protein